MLSDVLGIIYLIVLIGVCARVLRDPSRTRRKVRGLQEQKFQRRGIPVSEAVIERRVRASVRVGWAMVLLAAVLTVWLLVRLAVAVVPH